MNTFLTARKEILTYEKFGDFIIYRFDELKVNEKLGLANIKIMHKHYIDK